MKSAVLASLALPGAVLADSAADYVNFIRQIQQDTGLEWDMTVLSEGDGLVSPTGVSVDGSFFELWSIHNTTAAEYLLDEQFVTSYTPNAYVEIITGDPYQPVRRTRADQPFQVRVTVTGLMHPSDALYAGAPQAAKRVDYLHTSFSYPEGEHSLENVSSPVGTLQEEGYMEENTTATVTFNVTNLTGSDLTQVEGEEVFTISALADFGVSATVLDSERVQIWPVAQGSFSGYDPAVRYENVPPVVINLVDLYPSSTTYLRVYAGEPTSNPVDPVTISSSFVVIEDSIPQDRTLVLKNLDRYFKAEGAHTLELLHETPFGTDLIHSSAILVDRTVEVTATIYSQ